MITWIKNVNKFSNSKSSTLGCLLDFWQFQPGIVYNSVAYKKSVYSNMRVGHLYLKTFVELRSNYKEKHVSYIHSCPVVIPVDKPRQEFMQFYCSKSSTIIFVSNF